MTAATGVATDSFSAALCGVQGKAAHLLKARRPVLGQQAEVGTPEKGFLPGRANLLPRPEITDPINFSMRSAAHLSNQWMNSA